MTKFRIQLLCMLLCIFTYLCLIIICKCQTKSRHTVVCQWPRKQKKTCGTQMCYLLVPQSCQIQPSVSPKLLSRFLQNLYIFCLTYTPLHISNLKEIASAVLEIFVPKNCLIFFTFSSSSSHKITNTFKSHKNNLPMFRFLSNSEHL